MITVTLGTIPYSFNRAINWIALLLRENLISEPVFIQYGVSDIAPLSQHPLVKTAPLLEAKDLDVYLKSSRLVISHAGQGSTRKLVEQGINFVLIPRLSEYGEHIDDHQLMYAKSVAHLGVQYCLTLEELRQVILEPPPLIDKKFLQSPKLIEHLLQMYPPSQKG